ncbi:MAG: AAA family ATPase [Eubacteriaceae bacterium]|jgi:cytidylate kinase
MKDHIIITISRQLGSGGSEIAEKLAERLGVHCYNRQIINLVAEKLKDSGDTSDDVIEESYKTLQSSLGNLGEYGLESTARYNQMYKEQSAAVINIAKNESAVFVGRCADFTLRNDPDHYAIFIYANDAFRIKHAEENNMSIKDLNRLEKDRERYYSYHTGQKWGDKFNYDLLLNTSCLTVDQAVELLMDYITVRNK